MLEALFRKKWEAYTLWLSEQGNVTKEEVDDIIGKLVEFQESFQSDEDDDCFKDSEHFMNMIGKIEDRKKEFLK